MKKEEFIRIRVAGWQKKYIRELRRQGNNQNQLVVMARQGHVELVNMEPLMEVYTSPTPPRRTSAVETASCSTRR